MQKLSAFLLVLSLITTRLYAQNPAPIPNGNFEDGAGTKAFGWTYISGDVERIDSQSLTINGSPVVHHALEGQYFLRLTTVDTVINGKTLAAVGSAGIKFKYTEKPAFLLFYVMYLNEAENDRFKLQLLYTKYNSGTKKSDVLLRYSIVSDSNTVYYPWTKFVIPITYNDSMPKPDTLSVYINSAADNQQAFGIGTTLWIDYLKLSNTDPNGIESRPPGVASALSLYPNPASDHFQLAFSLERPAAASINLYDISGRMVKQVYSGRMKAGRQELYIDASEVKPGIYFCTLQTEGQRVTEKIIISR